MQAMYATGVPCICCGRLIHDGRIGRCSTCRLGYHYHGETVIYCRTAPAPKREPVKRPPQPRKPRREWWNR
jgi:hypothetical protein